jgi:hypothetical protein
MKMGQKTRASGLGNKGSAFQSSPPFHTLATYIEGTETHQVCNNALRCQTFLDDAY